MLPYLSLLSLPAFSYTHTHTCVCTRNLFLSSIIGYIRLILRIFHCFSIPSRGLEYISPLLDFRSSHMTCFGQQVKLEVEGIQFQDQVFKGLGIFHLTFSASAITKNSCPGQPMAKRRIRYMRSRSKLPPSSPTPLSNFCFFCFCFVS